MIEPLGRNRAPVVRNARPITKKHVPLHLHARRIGRHSLKFTLELFGGLAVVGLLCLALVYGRLSKGPISLGFLAASIEKAVNGELSDGALEIGGVVIQLGEQGGIEIRLTNVSLLNSERVAIAEAPYAAVTPSLRALLSGRVAAGSVDFIGPKMLLHFTDERGLAVSVAKEPPAPAATSAVGSAWMRKDARGSARSPMAEPDAAGRAVSGASAVNTAPPGEGIALAPALYNLFSRLHRSGSASYLNRFGIADAHIYLVRGEKLSQWTVPRLDIELVHHSNRSMIIGQAQIGDTSHNWQLRFKAEQRRHSGTLSLGFGVENVVPRELAGELPVLSALSALDLPVSATLRAALSRNGDVLSASGDLSLGRGLLYAPWNERHPMALNDGRVRFRFSRKQGRFELLPSDLRWGQSRMTLAGLVSAEPAQQSASFPGGAEPDRDWRFAFATRKLVLDAEDYGLPAIPLDGLRVRGRYHPSAERLDLDNFLLRAADASITLKGSLTNAPGAPAVNLTGEISRMPVAFLKLIWPKFVAPGAREWVGENVSAGTLTGGTIEVAIPAGVLDTLDKDGDLPASAAKVRLGFDGLAVRYIKGMPPLKTGASTAMLVGRRFVFNVPESRIDLENGQSLTVTDGQMVIGDLRPHIPDAEIHFRIEGRAGAALVLLDHPPLGYVSAVGLKPQQAGGTVQGSFGLTLPLAENLKFEDLKIRGRAHLHDPRVSGLFGRFSLNGGELAFGVSEKALEADGELKVNGVPVRLAWHRIFDAPADRQPGIRLSATLDNQARDRLGFKINHLVRGPVAAELSIHPGSSGASPKIHLDADLSNCELFMINVATRKPPGQRALLSFDIEDRGTQTLLDNFRVIGDGLSFEGAITLDAQKIPVAFDFPRFSPSLLTRLRVKGKRHANLWRITATGDSYDGKQLFRSLFSAGKLSEDQPRRPDSDWGIDLHAEIGTVIGYFDTTAKAVRVDLKKRRGQITALDMVGRLDGKAPIAARIAMQKDAKARGRKTAMRRILLAEATDAGAAFRLVGLYRSMAGGNVSIKVNLDGEGEAVKTGRLYAVKFHVLGDPVVDEVLFGNEGSGVTARARNGGKRRLVRRTQIEFNRMQIAFSVGHGQFVLGNAVINGPLLGATMRGRIDLAHNRISLSGTYVPLYGLNAALGQLPILGDLLISRRGEGLLGITFGIQGNADKPQVLVNPVSMVAPGFLRQIFEFDANPPRVVERPKKSSAGAKSPVEARTSSMPPLTR